MSKAEELKKSLTNKIAKRKDFIKKVKDLSDLAADAEEQNKEDEAKLFFAENMPESVLEERGGPLVLFEKYDEEQLGRYLPEVPTVTQQTRNYMISGTSDSSEYYGIAQTYKAYEAETEFPYAFTPTEIELIEKVYVVLSDLVEEKSKKETLPPRLEKINSDLGEKFVVALQSYEKAKGEIVGVDQSAIQLRDVIEQLWGGIVKIIRETDPRRYKGVELNLDAKGKRIAVDCLAPDDVSKQKLVLLLEKLSDIKGELSKTELGKNPLSKDTDKLKDLYSQWLLVIDDIVGFLFLNQYVE